jgi:hypothetical protein
MGDELNQNAGELLTLTTPDHEIKLKHHVARLQRAANALRVIATRQYFSVERATMILAEVDELAEDITLLCAALHDEPLSTILPATVEEIGDGDHPRTSDGPGQRSVTISK